ncbi:MAG: hypothetical protein IPM29_18000, partial [Planctomycetes bacterium]|nr:hypothetical protein [Planctomycetota bacterium]
DVARLCDALCELQQAFTPDWRRDVALGEFAASNAEVRTDPEVTARAALALVDAVARLGGRTLTERTACALRAALAAGAQPLAWTVAVAAERRLGDVVVDPERAFACAVSDVIVESCVASPGTLDLRVTTFAAAPSERRRIAVTLLPFGDPERVPPTLRCGGEELAFRPALQRVELSAAVVPRVEFAPPTRLPSGSTWLPTATVRGPSTDHAFEVELRMSSGFATRATLLRDGDRLAPLDPIRLPRIDGEATLLARVIETSPGRTVVHPAAGPRRIRVGELRSIDFGDEADERLSDAEADRRTPVVRFVDGRENARLLPPGEPLRVSVPVAERTPQLALTVRASGSLAIADGDGRLLAAAPEELVDRARDVTLALADPRLWRDGTLELVLATTGAEPAEVANLTWRADDPSELPPLLAASAGAPRRLPADLQVLAVPIHDAGAPPTIDAELLRQALFGGPENRVSPDGGRGLTIGSARSWLRTLSGGVTELGGAVRAPLAIAFDGTPPAERPARIVAALREALADAPESVDPDVVLAVGGALGIDPDTVRVAATAGQYGGLGAPVVLLSASQLQGRTPGVADLVEGVLRALTDFVDFRTPEHGNLGRLALSASPDRLLPAPPLGPNLAAAGWVDVVTFDATRPASIALPPSLVGRQVLRLPFPGDRRGELWIEQREPAGGDDRAGLLLLRHFAAGREPLVVRLDGQRVRPGYLRLSAGLPGAVDAPFVPGSRRDLLRAASRVDDGTRPSLATSEGELPWVLTDVRTDGTIARLTAEPQWLDLLAAATPELSTGRGAARRPLPLDTAALDGARATRAGRGLRIEPARDEACTVALHALRRPPVATRARLSLSLRGLDPACAIGLRVLQADAPVDGAQLLAPADSDAVRVEVDLPATSAGTPLAIELELPAGAPALWITEAVLVARASAAAQVRLTTPDGNAARLTPLATDQETGARGYATALELDPRGGPTDGLALLPAGACALALHVALPPDVDRATLTVRLRELDGTLGTLLLDEQTIDRGGPRTLLLELPPRGMSRAAVVELAATCDGTGGLRVLDAQVRR